MVVRLPIWLCSKNRLLFLGRLAAPGRQLGTQGPSLRLQLRQPSHVLGVGARPSGLSREHGPQRPGARGRLGGALCNPFRPWYFSVARHACANTLPAATARTPRAARQDTPR